MAWAQAVDLSKDVFPLLYVDLLLPFFVGVLCFVIVLLYITLIVSFLVLQSSIYSLPGVL